MREIKIVPDFKNLKLTTPNAVERIRRYERVIDNRNTDTPTLAQERDDITEFCEAEFDNPKSLFVLHWYGLSLLEGRNKIPVDVKKGIMFLEKAADGDHKASVRRLARLYGGEERQGRTYLMPRRSFLYYQKLEDGGAYFKLACAYAHGKGVKTDTELARHYIQKSAEEEKNLEAMMLMGQWLYDGFVFEQDRKKACVLFQKVHLATNIQRDDDASLPVDIRNSPPDSILFLLVDAKYWIGLCLMSEKSYENDVNSGARLIFEAAEMGHEKAIQWKNDHKAQFSHIVVNSPSSPKERLKKMLKSFDGYVGLENIKERLQDLFYTELANQRRLKENKTASSRISNMHMVFTGNPGTGKTVAARLVGKALAEAGFLKSGHVVEVDRSKLVGEYIGHSEKITHEVLKAAKDGVLFIDEAYDLNNGSHRDFGRLVITTLVKAMEDMRGNIAVVMAGYPEPMQWLLDSNPGLRSRIGLMVNFPDYTVEQLVQIFENMCTADSYTLSDLAREKLVHQIKYMPPKQKEAFGNARGVRNLFEETLRLQSKRIIENDITEKDQLFMILPQDIPGNAKPPKDGQVQYLSSKIK